MLTTIIVSLLFINFMFYVLGASMNATHILVVPTITFSPSIVQSAKGPSDKPTSTCRPSRSPAVPTELLSAAASVQPTRRPFLCPTMKPHTVRATTSTIIEQPAPTGTPTAPVPTTTVNKRYPTSIGKATCHNITTITMQMFVIVSVYLFSNSILCMQQVRRGPMQPYRRSQRDHLL